MNERSLKILRMLEEQELTHFQLTSLTKMPSHAVGSYLNRLTTSGEVLGVQIEGTKSMFRYRLTDQGREILRKVREAVN